MTRTDRPTRSRMGLEVGLLAAALLAYNNFVQGWEVSHRLYVPLNLAALGALVAWSRRRRLTGPDLGLEPHRWGAGVRAGLVVGVVATIGLFTAVMVPGLRSLVQDQRAAGLAAVELISAALIRIPIGTALFEEFAFRGVLFGAWQRMSSATTALVGSSVVFGLWHIRPAASAIEANGLDGGTTWIVAIAAAVAATTAAGAFFCWLRIRWGLLAPIVAHAIINSAALVAAATALALG